MKLVKNNKKKGFTLIELVVVIAILAVLALILVPTISGYVGKAEKARDEANTRQLYMAATLVTATSSETLDSDAAKKAVEAYGDFGSNYSVTVVNGKVTSVTYNGMTYDGSGFTGN